jgi:dCMP deaminase
MTNSVDRWDSYFYLICQSVASKSPCLSRKIGAVIVRDNSIVSTGYNGPPRGVPHCGHDRFMNDKYIANILTNSPDYGILWGASDIKDTCPRRLLQYDSGTHMELCSAQHAEENAITNAARNGVSTLGCTLYMNSVQPCKNCIGTLMNAGITEIVIEKIIPYDQHSLFIYDHSLIKIRTFGKEIEDGN